MVATPRTLRVWVPRLLFGAVVIAVTLGAGGRASRKLLWHDEIVTLAILRQPLSELLPMLRSGVDYTPPLFHVATEAGLYMPLPELIALRSVSIAMFVIGLVGVYAFVSYRGDAWDALAAVCVLALSGAQVFAYEARSYAMLLAFTTLAFVCWQRAAHPTTPHRSRVVPCVALALCLAAAVSSHYYAVLLPIPFGVAELVKLRARRRIDWGIIAAVVTGLSPLLAYLPFIRGGMSQTASFYSAADVRVAVASYEKFGVSLISPTVACTVAVVVTLMLGPRLPQTWQAVVPQRATTPLEDWVASLVLLLFPVIALVLAAVTGAGYVERYTVAWTVGLAFCVGLVAQRLSRQIVIAAVVAFATWLGLRELHAATYLIRPAIDVQQVYAALQRLPPLPIAVPHPHVFIQLKHYLPPQVAERVMYVDRPPGRSTPHTDVASTVIVSLRKWYPLEAISVEALGTRGPFYLYTPQMYTVDMLLTQGADLRLLAIDDGDTPFAPNRAETGKLYLYEVRMPVR